MGALTGSPEYIRARSQSLVDTFSTMLARNLQLIDHSAGCTDCATFIRAPLSDPEGYLVVEHEVSHNLFGTDLPLTDEFCRQIVEKLLRRAKIVPSSPQAAGYTQKLYDLVFHLWNILEDWRCCWLWSQLYPGGGSLLEQRWKDICKYDISEERAESDLLTYLSRRAGEVETPRASAEFQRCGRHMIRARNLVEGVDAEACLAITARLVDDIADELLDKYPPDRTVANKKKLDALSKAISGGPSGVDSASNPLGGKDLQHSSGRRKKVTAGQLGRIKQAIKASDDDSSEDVDGMTSFQAMLDYGASQMEERLEQARAQMSAPKCTKEEESKNLLTAALKAAKIPGSLVTPAHNLPRPTAAAARMRAHLEQVKMNVRLELHEDGDDLDIEAFIDARLSDELAEAELFYREVAESGMTLLILGDLSGSMLGMGLDLLEQAIADTAYACAPMDVDLHLWGFSDSVFVFTKVGSPRGVPGVRMGGTRMVEALDAALEWAKKETTSRGVILLTDGFPTSLRGRNTTGNALDDLKNVVTEMKADGIVLSILAIGNYPDVYDQGFGKGGYAMLPDLRSLAQALPETAKKLVEAFTLRGTR